MVITIPSKIGHKFLDEVLSMYSRVELSAGRAAEMLGICRVEFYDLLKEKKIRLPEKLNESIMRELTQLKSTTE